MRTFYFGDELSEYKVEYIITIRGSIHIVSTTRLCGHHMPKWEIKHILCSHLKDLGYSFEIIY